MPTNNKNNFFYTIFTILNIAAILNAIVRLFVTLLSFDLCSKTDEVSVGGVLLGEFYPIIKNRTFPTFQGGVWGQ